MVATRANDQTKVGLSANLIHKPGRTKGIKAYKSDDGKYGWVEGYLVSWGDPQDTDLQGEFFSPRTEFCLDWFRERPVLYHHGLDGQAGLRKIGVIKSVEPDELGLWVQAQIDLRDRYANAVYDMVKTKEFGWSSGSVDHLVKIADSGEIAVWPLIEGSITPTPAQPSKTAVRPLKSGSMPFNVPLPAPKTSYRAFKAILSGDDNTHDFLRGLDARVGQGVHSTKSLYSPYGGSSMARATSQRLARKYADAFGVDADEAEINAIASDLEEDIDAEIAVNAANELEREASLAAYDDMVRTTTQEDTKMARSYRSRRRSNRRYKNDTASTMTDELAAHMDDIAAEMADEIAAEMEDEIGGRMDDIRTQQEVKRAIRRRAMRRAARNLEATDDIDAALPGDPGIGQGGVGDYDYLGDMSVANPPIENYKRARRNSRRRPVRRATRRGYRNTDPMMTDDIRSSEDAMLMEAVAERAYRNGFRKGVRRGFRTTDQIAAPDTMIVEGNSETGNFNELPYSGGDITVSKRARRSYRRRPVRRARRRGYRNDESYASDEEATATDEAKAYRRGYRAALRRARRNDDSLMSDEMEKRARRRGRRNDDSLMSDEMEKRARRRGYRNTDESLASDELAKRARRRARRNDESLASDDMEKRARRNSRRRARRNDESLLSDDAVLRARRRARRNDDSLMSDEMEKRARRRARRRGYRNEDAYSSDGESVMMDEVKRARRRAKSAGFGGNVDYWKRRAMKAELSEAPSQRRFSRMNVTDEADRPGAYNHAFKSYLYKGLGLMTDSEKYVLQGRGRTNWRGTKGVFAAPGSDPRIKTYFGGSDASAGFAVPPDWVAELNKNVMTQTVMAPECRTRTTTSDRIVQPNLITTDARRSHAAEVRWPGEVITDAEQAHRTIEDQYSQVDVPIHVMLMSLTAGNSALEDVSFSLEDEINEAFSEAVAIAYDELIWAGDGQGKLQGIVVNDQVTGQRSQNMQTVSGYVPSGSPDGIVTADVLKEMLFHMPRGYRQKAKWYMNSNTGLQVATLKDGEGNYLIDQRDESLQSVGVPDRLLGKPIVYNEYADDIFEDSFPILLGDLSRGYIIGKRVDFSIRRFDDSAYAELDQVLFLGRARLGGQVLQPAAIKALKVAAS